MLIGSGLDAIRHLALGAVALLAALNGPVAAQVIADVSPQNAAVREGGRMDEGW